ncbi:MAG: hypothetical protein QNJ46_10810 [Leptolyngbyaceae cyanobacterium MO_188.B28]|nr:hypothetical protein [Leptolyngbyaceae cyanobacterium MO_188.B28]
MVVLIFFLLEIIKILLPWLMLGGVVALGWWLWRRRQLEIRRRQQVFYGLLQTHQGRVSVLDFAIAANLSAHESKVFLDHRAEEFLANFEVTEKGDMLYVFNSHFMGKKVA